MINMILDVSKYLMILLMAAYTYLNFRFFSKRSITGKRKICGAQNRIMFLFHFLAYIVIILKSEDVRMIAFYGVQVIFFLIYIYLYRFLYPNVSRLLVNNMCMLLSTGFIMLSRFSFDKAVKQFMIVAIAAVAAWIIPFVIDRVWQLSRIPWIYGILGLFLLLLVWIAGNTSYGAQLSFTFWGVSIQPSEFVKISFVFFIATMFYHSVEFKTVVITTVVAAVHVLILVASKDLGSALLFFTTYLFMLFVATGKYGYLMTGFLGGTAAAYLAYLIFPHVQVRVMAWQNPWADIENKGYQIAQSLFAIGTGGWFGMGLYQGMPYKIPVVEKDFVFSAIAEEMGGVFAICMILICIGCFLQFMMIADKMQAVFYKLIAFGLGVVYITQVFLTVGGVIKFIPSTGVTLPFVSYGGSSIVSTFIIFGIVQGLYILKRNEEEEDEEYEEISS